MDLNKFVKKTKEATASVGKKANELVEATKINLEIIDLENQIDDLYKEVGILVFDSYKNQGEVPQSINEKCAVIEQKITQVIELKKKASEFKSTVICAVCQTQNDKTDQYCSNCGNKL